MVSFLEDPEQYKSCEMIEHIDASIQRLALGIVMVQSKLKAKYLFAKNLKFLQVNGADKKAMCNGGTYII